jgi:hypothetical protein
MAKTYYNQTDNPIIRQLHKLKLTPKLEDLQYHESENVYEHVSNVITKYFDQEDPFNL